MSNMTKHSHAVDSSVAERRLRPIYDWLDSGNNKKALQECEKVLKKSPKLQCARALKALTLHRMGKDVEATQILDELTVESPTDEPTLQAMTLCCREMKKLERICKLYESAAKLEPTNEEIQTQLFMSYVRIGDFKSQQMVAMTLYKHRPKNPYYCWAVMSVILQATRGEGASDPKKRNLLLSLAERMMLKLIQENKVEAEQEVQLYVMILEELSKFDEILNVLNGSMRAKLSCANLPELKLRYNKYLSRWSEVNLLCRNILLESTDRWDIWLQYIDSVFKLWTDSEQAKDDAEGVDDSPEKAHEFICRVLESFGMRGPYLARFELSLKMKENGANSFDLLGDPNHLFIEYFRKFGHKPCCVSDLRQYLCLLDMEQRADLASKLIKDVNISDTSVPQSLQQMQRHICALQLSRLCGSHRNLSTEHQKALITALSLHYQHGYQSYGSNLLPTDLGPSDPYILIAVHILNDLAHTETNSDYLITALGLINNLLKNSPSNFHAKLLGVRLNHLIGNVNGAQELYNGLDIKHLQLDSLGYIHCSRMSVTGHFAACANLFDTTINFFSTNYKDSSDHLTFSYKYGSFIKLDEFMDFRERLHDSVHYAAVEVDRIFLNLIETAGVDGLSRHSLLPSEERQSYDNLRNNYDLSVSTSWDPERIVGPPETDEDCKIYFDATSQYVKLRLQLLNSLVAAVELVQSEENDKKAKIAVLNDCVENWRKMHETIEVKDKVTNRINVPLPSRLPAYMQVPFVLTIQKFMQLLINVSNDDYSGDKSNLQDLKLQFGQLHKTIQCGDMSYLPARREYLELIVNCTELISISTVICGLCSEVTRRQVSGGKKNKKKGGTVNSNCNELTKTAVGIVVEAANSLADQLGAFCSTCESCNLSKLVDGLNLGDSDVCESVQSGLNDSYSNAVKEIRTVLKNKVKYLNGLV